MRARPLPTAPTSLAHYPSLSPFSVLGGEISKVSPEFPGAVKTILAFSPALHHATPAARAQVYTQMLRHIARLTNAHPFDRVEPRLIKRELARYAYLREPRWKARLKCLS